MTAALSAGDDEELRREADRVAQLVDELSSIGGAPVQQRVEEVVARLLHVYGVGLQRLLSMLDGDRPESMFRSRLLSDPLVSSLLVLHGLHPAPEAERLYDPDVAAAAEARRAAAHAGASELVQIDLSRGRGPKPGNAP